MCSKRTLPTVHETPDVIDNNERGDRISLPNFKTLNIFTRERVAIPRLNFHGLFEEPGGITCRRERTVSSATLVFSYRGDTLPCRFKTADWSRTHTSKSPMLAGQEVHTSFSKEQSPSKVTVQTGKRDVTLSLPLSSPPGGKTIPSDPRERPMCPNVTLTPPTVERSSRAAFTSSAWRGVVIKNAPYDKQVGSTAGGKTRIVE